MTEVKMLRSVPVSPDGLRIETWIAGQVYRASDDLLAQLINLGAVEIVETMAAPAAPEVKRARGRRRAAV